MRLIKPPDKITDRSRRKSFFFKLPKSKTGSVTVRQRKKEAEIVIDVQEKARKTKKGEGVGI